MTFGCRVNQADSLALESALSARGETASSIDLADIVIVNSCSVTAAADQGARQLIRKIHRANAGARIVVTGCYATRAASEVEGLPGVVRLVPNEAKDSLVEQIFPEADPERLRAETDEHGGIPVEPGVMGRTAYSLRVQTGCDQRCAFCVIPDTRGASRSRPVEALAADVGRLGRAGFKEIWLVGVHLGSYGRDLDPASTLFDLLRALDRVPGDVSFRLGSLEPMDCPPAVVDLIARSGRFAAHLHLPLQHASDSVLAAMRRPYTFDLYRDLVNLIRTRLPNAAIGADLIAGFPGETAVEFEASASSIAGLPLSYLHVFPYSERPGADSARLRPKVAQIEIQRRSKALRAIGRTLHDAFLQQQLGGVRPGLTLDDGTVVLTDNYLKVRIAAGHARNERLNVRIDRVEPPLMGTVVG